VDSGAKVKSIGCANALNASHTADVMGAPGRGHAGTTYGVGENCILEMERVIGEARRNKWTG